jgi:hypothetical protein
MLFYSSSFLPTCSRSLLFTSLFSISPPHLFSQPFSILQFPHCAWVRPVLYLFLLVIFNLFCLVLSFPYSYFLLPLACCLQPHLFILSSLLYFPLDS